MIRAETLRLPSPNYPPILQFLLVLFVAFLLRSCCSCSWVRVCAASTEKRKCCLCFYVRDCWCHHCCSCSRRGRRTDYPPTLQFLLTLLVTLFGLNRTRIRNRIRIRGIFPSNMPLASTLRTRSHIWTRERPLLCASGWPVIGVKVFVVHFLACKPFSFLGFSSLLWLLGVAVAGLTLVSIASGGVSSGLWFWRWAWRRRWAGTDLDWVVCVPSRPGATAFCSFYLYEVSLQRILSHEPLPTHLTSKRFLSEMTLPMPVQIMFPRKTQRAIQKIAAVRSMCASTCGWRLPRPGACPGAEPCACPYALAKSRSVDLGSWNLAWSQDLWWIVLGVGLGMLQCW